MKMSVRMALAFLGVLLVSNSASAVVFGPSNFSLGSYPRARCYEPSVPYSDDQYAWDRFRSDVRAYADCVNEYVEAGDNDIRRIQDAQHEAVRDAEEFLRRARR